MTDQQTGDNQHELRAVAPPDTQSSIGSPTAEQSSALLTTLTTQQFALQSAASTTVSEAVGRASIFLGVLSSSLIALGFAADRQPLLLGALAVLVPTIFLLGLFTVVRLVDTSGENLLHLAEMARIRSYYVGLHPDASRFFSFTSTASADDAFGGMGLRRSRLLSVFTLATMVAFVDAVVGGTGVYVLLRAPLTLSRVSALVSGLAFGAAFLIGFFRYQSRRLAALDGRAS
ncbi:hypothetical protein [uncultured Jatrophihabitans sp.]|uniref:hypothetical protein n=1 Tax=uncultured Jatrophihabitans sp. TaxID=1610747 RepID=UPI0035CB44F4